MYLFSSRIFFHIYHVRLLDLLNNYGIFEKEIQFSPVVIFIKSPKFLFKNIKKG
jgi:hypothetical protein